jgi:PhnB protein
VQVDPYLNFQGRCDEALDFYGAALGAEALMISRFGDIPGMGGPPQSAGKVMHAVVRIGGSTVLATDGASNGSPSFEGISLALSAPTAEAADAAFSALADAGEVRVPIGPTPFAPRFGIVVDRFGVTWNVVQQGAQR